MDVVHVEPARREWLAALLLGDDVFTARFGRSVEAGWAGFPEAVPVALAAARQGEPDGWGTHLFFATDDGSLVGFGGFKGAPRDGAVEVGYAVAPVCRGRGIATAATRWLVERARAAGVERVVAHTLAEPNASTAVLARCGFVNVATIADPDPDPDGGVAGDVWRWELPLDRGTA